MDIDAALAGVCALFAAATFARGRARAAGSTLIPAVAAAAAGVLAAFALGGTARMGLLALACGALLGALASLGGKRLVGAAFGGGLAGMALGLAAWLLPAEAFPLAAMGLTAGCALGGGLSALAGRGSSGSAAAAVLLSTGGISLGIERVVGASNHAPWLLMATVAAMLIASFFERDGEAADPRAFAILVALLAVGSLLDPSLAPTISVAALAAGAAAWSMFGRRGGLAATLAIGLWVGLATFAFTEARGLGMALAATTAAAALAASPSPSARLTLGPLIALAAYRFFRETYPDTSRALDIGQHYAILGIVIGIALALAPVEWARSQGRGLRGAVGGILVAALALGCCGVAIVMLGAKGSVGLLVGAGLAPAVEALRGEKSAAGLVSACGLLAAISGLYGLLQAHLDLSRDVKLQVLAIAAASALLIAGIVRSIAPAPLPEAHEPA